jgi:hypothetical protein
MAHVTVMVPEGHAIQVHPPGGVAAPMAGTVHDPMAVGAKAAMDAVMPTPSEAPAKDQRGKPAPTKSATPKTQPKRKEKPKAK